MMNTTKNRKVALFVPSLGGGGAERVMVDIANGLVKRDFEVDLLLGKAVGPYLTDVTKEVNIVDFGATRVLSCLPSLTKYLRRSKPDAVLSTLTHTNLITIFAKLISRFKGKLYVREASHLSAQYSSGNFKQKGVISLVKIFYRYVTKVVVLSQDVGVDLLKHHVSPDKLEYIYNPVVMESKLNNINTSNVHKWFSDKSIPVVVAVGRLEKQKDYPTLLYAFAKLNSERPLRLIILGEGSERDKLIALSKELNIFNAVDFMGFVSNPLDYLACANLYVLSSKFEGLPGALVQAMSTGIAIVSTNGAGGMREILDDGKYGLLVPVANVDAMAQAMEKQLDEPIYGQRLVERAKKLFGFDVNIDKYAKLLRE